MSLHYGANKETSASDEVFLEEFGDDVSEVGDVYLVNQTVNGLPEGFPGHALGFFGGFVLFWGWVGGVGGWVGRGEAGGWNELLYALLG